MDITCYYIGTNKKTYKKDVDTGVTTTAITKVVKLMVTKRYPIEIQVPLQFLVAKKKIRDYVTETTTNFMKTLSDDELTQIDDFITELFKPKRRAKVPVTIQIFDHDKITQEDSGYEGLGIKKERKKRK